MKTTWDLTEFYQNEEAIQSDILAVKTAMKEIATTTRNKDHLLKILEVFENGMRTLDHLYVYAHMKLDLDSRSSASQKLAMEMDQLRADWNSETSFLRPFILRLTDEELFSFYQNKNAEHFRLYIDRIRRYKDFTLGDSEEALLAKLEEAGSAGSNISYMLSYADMKFPSLKNGEEITQANMISFLEREDPNIRKEAFETVYKTYQSLINTFATSLYSNMKNLVTIANLRGFQSARDMELFTDDVDSKVYDSLIESIHQGLPDLYRYYQIKEKMLGLSQTHLYDVYLPLAKKEKYISFEEAKEMVLEAVKPLGEEYQEVMRRAFDEGWIDAFPREGKKSGAYSWGSYDSHPYILMNYVGNLDSVFTLIHELGHSMHSYFSRRENPYLYSHYTIFVAEVASTFNECLLIHYLLGKAQEDEEKIALINHYISSFKATVFRQTMFAEFEKICHAKIEEGQALTAEDFSEIHYELNQKYFGNKVVIDDPIRYEWARIPHFYNDFYVYKYATGFSAATILSQGVLHRKEGALENYLSFLKDGGMHFPVYQLQQAGADMADSTTVDRAVEVFRDLVNQLGGFIQ